MKKIIKSITFFILETLTIIALSFIILVVIIMMISAKILPDLSATIMVFGSIFISYIVVKIFKYIYRKRKKKKESFEIKSVPDISNKESANIPNEYSAPEGYSKIKKVDLQKDKKTAVLVNTGAVVIMIAVFIIGNIFVPVDLKNIFGLIKLEIYDLLVLLLIFFAIIAYMVAHEWVHGIFIKKYSGKKAKYGFTGLYAYAASEAYFNKHQYVIISLAPVILLGLIILLINIFTYFLFKEWFWAIYIIQMVNLSGAAGDIYITWLMMQLPIDILVNDEGVSMTIYSRTK